MRTLILIISASVAVTAATAAELPFRLATKPESLSLTGTTVIATTLDQTDFKTAATVLSKKTTYGALGDTMRADHAVSMVYKASMDVGPDPGHSVPPAEIPSDLVNYEVNHNAAQSWATMSETGAPFVMVYEDGMAEGRAAASWNTKYTVQGSGSRDVYARFTIPNVKFGGRWEDAVPSMTQGRMRIDFLVNGYPAWSTEAVRFNQDTPGTGDTVRVESFGHNIGFEGFSQGSITQNLSTESRVVTVKLGTYPAGKVFDVTMLFQAEGKGAAACKSVSNETECGSVSVKIDWDPTAPQPTFYSKVAQ